MSSRVSGKAVAPIVAVALLGTVGALIYFFLGEQSVDTPPVSTLRIDEGEIRLQPGHTQRGYFFLSRHDDERERWRVGVYGYQEGTRITRVRDLVALRTKRSSGQYETHAFRIDNGEFAWSGGTPPPPLVHTGAPGPTFALEDQLIEVYIGEPGYVVALDPSDGKTLFSHIGPVPEGATVDEDRSVLRIPTEPPTCYALPAGETTDCP